MKGRSSTASQTLFFSPCRVMGSSISPDQLEFIVYSIKLFLCSVRGRICSMFHVGHWFRFDIILRSKGCPDFKVGFKSTYRVFSIVSLLKQRRLGLGYGAGKQNKASYHAVGVRVDGAVEEVGRTVDGRIAIQNGGGHRRLVGDRQLADGGRQIGAGAGGLGGCARVQCGHRLRSEFFFITASERVQCRQIARTTRGPQEGNKLTRNPFPIRGTIVDP